MNKKIIFLVIVVLIMYFISNNNVGAIKIPDEAIRIRVVANSNSEYDQTMKLKVSDNIQKEVYTLLKEVEDIETARRIIKENIGKLDNSVKTTLLKNSYDISYKINFGENYFPEKEFNGIIYDEGYYESLLITLGEGNGDNWWCVLFPPLCLLEAEESDEVEYKFFVQELIDKYF